MTKFKNKVVVITGGSSGIGNATVNLFLQEGAKVAVFDQQESLANNDHDNYCYFQGDVSNLAALSEFYQLVNEKWGKIDILVANAGVGTGQPFHEVTEELFDKVITVNYKGIYFTVQRAYSYLADNAAIILLAAATIYGAVENHSLYASTKAAVKQLARNFSTELAAKGIRVNSISPGFVNTPIWQRREQVDKQIRKKLAAKVPLQQRMAEVTEIANVIAFLASNQASYITGEDIVIDAGVTRAHAKFS